MTTKDEPLWRYCYRSWAINPLFDVIFVLGLLAAELILGLLIIDRVPYTEIDWQAYMEEVETYEAGERDYTKIRGGTGPLVYPAGFLYVFSALKAWTNDGTDIRMAQYIFLGFYLATQAVVLSIYHQCLRSTSRSVAEIWSWRFAMGCLCLSKRIHSIFLLRLFNDGPTMLLLYISIYLFNKNKWSIGCFMFSFAVSIKMNVLLFAPGLLLLLLQTSRHWHLVILRLGLCCATPQLLLGAPFLLTYPVSYLRKAFELDRVFFYKWTVNWKFLPEELFVSKSLSILLLALHLTVLLYLFVYRMSRKSLFLGLPLHPMYITQTLLLSNFVGICFARTLHYQFYSWYFHALPFLLWSSRRIPIALRLICLVVVESSFLTFPATSQSSAFLQIAHAAILLSTVMALVDASPSKNVERDNYTAKHHIE